MSSTANLSRREFFQSSAAGTVLLARAIVAPSDGPAAAWAASSAQDEVRLRSWELVELPGLTMRPDKEGRRLAIRITATNDAVGVMPVRSCKGFSDATVQILKTHNLAWDPYPGSAESATRSLDEAKEILALMDELGYSWIEGPLPPVPFEQQIPKYVELLTTGTKQRIQAEGPGSPIGDGTSFDVMRQWADAGAIGQCSTDVYIANGVTNALRMIDYAKSHPPLVINLHWAWMPHAHLAMACDEKLMPLVEFPMGEDFPKSILDGPHLLAPDWPGIYRWEDRL